jgi:aldehyde:ferredoxin oxidoreductase
LAEGSARAARLLGPEAEARVVAVKGSEVPAHMPQVKASMGLIYAVNPFGADHQSSEHDPFYEPGAAPLYRERLAAIGLDKPVPSDDLGAEKVRFTLLTQYLYSVMDTLCWCQFDWGPAWQLYGPEWMPTVVRGATGWDVTLDELMQVGARRVAMMRAFNALQGLDTTADVLPPRLFAPLQGGLTDGVAYSPTAFAAARAAYYALAGCDPHSGRPTREHLTGLGLDWVADLFPIPEPMA